MSILPSATAASKDSRVTRLRRFASCALRSAASRFSAIWRAVRSSSVERKVSPARGTVERPRTCTGRDGPASFTAWPFSSNIARTRPCATPATIASPTCRVPDCTRTVETAPRPLSRFASMATPRASLFGLARSSRTSAVRVTASSSSSILVPLRAETFTNMVSPP